MATSTSLPEHRTTIDGVDITFKFKPARYDTEHLIVVFSGFGGSGEFTYDMERVLQDSPASVLWIKDDFSGHCTYYLTREMSFEVRDAVHAFIEGWRSDLGLARPQVTLAGFSKGGSAALYFGLQYDFANIVATVPQFHIGSYVRRLWPAPAQNMMGEVNDENTRVLDEVLPDALRSDTQRAKNIYLLSSPADPQFEVEIAPYLTEFKKYDNFNFFFSRSRLVRAHNQVTGHHVPLLIGVLHSLASGVVPRYGEVDLMGNQADGVPSFPLEPVAELRNIAIRQGRVFPQGVALIRGVPCEEWSDIQVTLVLKFEQYEASVELAKDHQPILTRELYRDGFVSYDKGWFTSHGNAGLDFAGLAPGRYQVFLDIDARGHQVRTALTCDRTFRAHDADLGLTIESAAGEPAVWVTQA